MRAGKKLIACFVESTLGVMSGRWKVLVLHSLLSGPRRFSELVEPLRGISHRTLSRQLRELERDGLVRKGKSPTSPTRVEYSLTALGESLRPVLGAMHEWGRDYAKVCARGDPRSWMSHSGAQAPARR